ncbi:MAG TPA: hypothetical protein ENJ09_04660 [Planctomycetes bacterium]|nr:hypothetical protein [Planctomycetota bacterium]
MKARNPTKHWNPYLGGAFLGFVLFLAFLLTGHGLGASGGIARLLAGILDTVALDHVRTSPYLSRYAEAPLQHWIVPLIGGVFLGGLLSSVLAGRAKVETLRGPRISARTRLVFALLGGIIAGYGARLARGCTSGQALTGGATLVVGSWAFMFAAFGGGFAVAWFVRKLWT